MDFVNETKVEAGWTLGFEPDGRELLVVVIKATFQIPEHGKEPQLADEQVPLTEADEFTGEPGFSATLYESDYAHRKPFCDVLLNGSAYAPSGRPTEAVRVTMRVGTMNKSFNVVGDRFWERDGLADKPGFRKRFTKIPISYDRAYGGVDKHPDEPEKLKTYMKNPIGVGYYPYSTGKNLIGKPMPNTEEIGKPINSRDGKYNPMAFGPMGRNFDSRIPYAGTYDQKWLDNMAPFWPKDFDYRYFQAAPADQQIRYIDDGDYVILHNLSPEGLIKFEIPQVYMPVTFMSYKHEDIIKEAVLDTILIEPDHSRFMLTWRVPLPLRQNCFELKQVIAGEMPRSWYWQMKSRCQRENCITKVSLIILSTEMRAERRKLS